LTRRFVSACVPAAGGPQLVEGQERLESFLNEGPHLLIANVGMRNCWRIYCRAWCSSPSPWA
jgi:hypothetical protein